MKDKALTEWSKTELWTVWQLFPLPLQWQGHSCGVREQPGFIPVAVAEGVCPEESAQHACVGHHLVHRQHEGEETCCRGDQTPHRGLCVPGNRQKHVDVNTRWHYEPNRKLFIDTTKEMMCTSMIWGNTILLNSYYTYSEGISPIYRYCMYSFTSPCIYNVNPLTGSSYSNF